MPSIDDIKNWMLTNIAKPVMDTYNSAPIQNTMTALDPIGSTLRNVIEKQDTQRGTDFQESFRRTQLDAADAVPMQAMIPRKENIAQFLKAVMKSDVPASIVKKYPDLGTALSIAEARAPNQMAQAKTGGPIRIEPHDNQDYGGYFSPGKKQITIVAHPTGNKVEDAYHMMKNYMNIALHEATHADQYLRKSNRADPTELLVHDSPLLKPGQVGTYITPEASRIAVGNNSLYRNQPVEVDAFRRGKIAEDTISELSDLLPREVPRQPFTGTSKNINEDMQKLSSYFNRAIKEANRLYKDNPDELKFAVKDLKREKSDAMSKLEIFRDRPSKNPFKQQQRFDESVVYDPESVMYPKLADVVRNKLLPFANQSLRDLQMNSLIRKVQDAKGVGPMAEWFRKSLGIEKAAGQLTHDEWIKNLQRIYPQNRKIK